MLEQNINRQGFTLQVFKFDLAKLANRETQFTGKFPWLGRIIIPLIKINRARAARQFCGRSRGWFWIDFIRYGAIPLPTERLL